MIDLMQIAARREGAPLRYARGHFATNHSHINYYIDITYQKTRLSEAKAVARGLVHHFNTSNIVDTILCLDGTAVIGTCLANELTKSGFMSINSHQTIYVVEPEYNANSQMIFREGECHESLYEMEFGVLLMSVCAKRIMVRLDESGGMIDLVYGIEIEQTTAGEVDYHLEVYPK